MCAGFYLDFSDSICYNSVRSCQARRRLTSLISREGLFSPSINVEGGDIMIDIFSLFIDIFSLIFEIFSYIRDHNKKR